MRNLISISLMAILFFLVFACSTEKNKSTETAEKQMDPPKHQLYPKEVISVGKCRLEGTVVEILEPTGKENKEDPCSKYPCVAKIKIDKIIGYGSAFPAVFHSEQIISVKFSGTLMPSAVVDPESGQKLPGLEKGDSFKADISSMQAMGEKSIQTFLIFDYHKK